jgi:hypothetical protein
MKDKATKDHQTTSDQSSNLTGRADVRFRVSTGKYRMRIYAIAPEQLETISLALERARRELSTNYDAVALEALCMNYLSGGSVAGKRESLAEPLTRGKNGK